MNKTHCAPAVISVHCMRRAAEKRTKAIRFLLWKLRCAASSTAGLVWGSPGLPSTGAVTEPPAEPNAARPRPARQGLAAYWWPYAHLGYLEQTAAGKAVLQPNLGTFYGQTEVRVQQPTAAGSPAAGFYHRFFADRALSRYYDPLPALLY